MISRELDGAKKEQLESLHRQWHKQVGTRRALPFQPRIQTADDIRNHQGNPNQFLSKCEFDKLIADIRQVYTSRDPFCTRVIQTVRNDVGAGCSGAAVLDLYSVYALLFDTKQNEFYLSLDAKEKIELDKRLKKVAQKQTIVSIAQWNPLGSHAPK